MSRLLPVIGRVRDTGQDELLPKLAEIARYQGDLQAAYALRAYMPDFVEWFRSYGLIRFGCVYHPESRAWLMLDGDAVLITQIVTEIFGDWETFWGETLGTLRTDSTCPPVRLALLECLAERKPLIVPDQASSRTVDERFAAYAQDHGIQVLQTLQVGCGRLDPRSSVFLVIDTDGLVKVFKELPPDDPIRFAPSEDEAALYEQVGNQVGLPRFYGVTSIGETRFLRTGVCYGQSLVDYTSPQNLLSREEACYVVGKVAEILAALHDRGMAYLDLRPENVKVDGRDVYLLDLGDARRLSGPGGTVATHIHDVRYVSPEMVFSAQAGTASDVFQLGVLLHELLTGSRPLERACPVSGVTDGYTCQLLAHAFGAYTGEVHPLLSRMLAHDPSERPSAGEVVLALQMERARTIIVHRGRRLPTARHGTVLFPARMGIPHRGHIDFMARILELGYSLVVSVQSSYRQLDTDPVPKWLVAKMVARSLQRNGFDLTNVRFLCTPFFATRQRHCMHFALMPGVDDIVAVASGNPDVPALFGDRWPIIDQATVFGHEREDYETRSWGARLRSAVRCADRQTFDDLVAPGVQDICSFDELRAFCSRSPLEFVWGHDDRGWVYAVVHAADGAVLGKRRVGAYGVPEDAATKVLPCGVRVIDAFSRDTLVEMAGLTRALRWDSVELDAEKNELIHYTLL